MSFEKSTRQIKITRDEILAELHHSLEKQNVVGIFLKGRNELLTTAVRDIQPSSDTDYVITLFDHDLHGYPITETFLLLSAIDHVIRFNVCFDDPQYVNVRRKEKFKV